mmetsp:Transcript_14799/g.37765  ORF Transcript_14799/g.37765 Transcript_14799/m.37765 type:complete len:325 (-) Transcript_14799:241-1215(-)
MPDSVVEFTSSDGSIIVPQICHLMQGSDRHAHFEMLGHMLSWVAQDDHMACVALPSVIFNLLRIFVGKNAGAKLRAAVLDMTLNACSILGSVNPKLGFTMLVEAGSASASLITPGSPSIETLQNYTYEIFSRAVSFFESILATHQKFAGLILIIAHLTACRSSMPAPDMTRFTQWACRQADALGGWVDHPSAAPSDNENGEGAVGELECALVSAWSERVLAKCACAELFWGGDGEEGRDEVLRCLNEAGETAMAAAGREERAYLLVDVLRACESFRVRGLGDTPLAESIMAELQQMMANSERKTTDLDKVLLRKLQKLKDGRLR